MSVEKDTPRPRPARQLDLALIRIRWAIVVLIWLLSFIETGALVPDVSLLTWLGFYTLFNLADWISARWRAIPPRHSELTLAIDTILFAALPFVAPGSSPLFFLFDLFPAITGGLRFGAYLGALVAGILTLPFELVTLSNFLPPQFRSAIPFDNPLLTTPTWLGILPLMLFGVVFLVGYISKRERESTLSTTTVELEELRGAVSSAQIFYRTVDALSSSLNYGRVLEGMLDAGIKGLPFSRREDEPGVGIVLFFGTEKTDKSLHVVAWRNLDRTDPNILIPGKTGIVAEGLHLGEPLTFHNASTDPELSSFGALRRCRAGVCYPLQAGLEQYGVVILASPTPRLPSADQFEMMRAFTSQAAVAFQNTKMYGNLRAERDRIIDGDARARTKLARDLHDGPIQKVAAASMNIDFVRKLIERDPAKAQSELEGIHQLLDVTVKEMRDLLFTLRPLTLETEGLSAALRQLGVRLNKNEGARIEMNVDNFGPELGDLIGGTVFSVVEEAINNARKHAAGSRIFVSITEQEGTLVAQVQDDGAGFNFDSVNQNYEQRGSLGLVTMRERAQLVEGHLTIESAPGRGTLIRLVVPLARPASLP